MPRCSQNAISAVVAALAASASVVKPKRRKDEISASFGCRKKHWGGSEADLSPLNFVQKWVESVT